ncbi:calmodulin-binding transcription activator 1 isoform X2 [Sipha flava]|uniref:Calmodulin-binding transcription activator 1 isoform X2 n=1 Tax=Sipha flava TaxID=143950 RepID=A0A8B8FBK3_9HEMI|nr:calmodulin-binding transcription activator 1 isoform X2 [Sipha flava]
MSNRNESFAAEYCPGETVTLYSQQHHTRIHLQNNGHTNNHIPLNQKGEPIKLPDNLESLPRAEHFPVQRHRWNTNEEIAAILINFERHNEWQSKEVKIRPKSGSMLLYSRKKVRYRRDGYCWKKRKDGKTTREDHMKLKVQGTECIYGCYVHSAILPTFHRRCYWLLQNPDMVLVHYLNVPYPDDNKLSVISPSLALWADRKEWTKDELLSQLKPMFYEEDPDLNNEMEVSTAECVAAMVTQLMEWQKNARATLLSRTLECGCPDSTCADGQSCSRPIRRISPSDSNQVSSTTGNRSRPGTMLLTNHHVNPSRTTMNTLMITNHVNKTQNGQTSLNNNLLSDSTRDFRNQSQQQPQPQQSQQQIILKHECRDNNQILNNRQSTINVANNNHIPTTMISYKPQGADEVIHIYTEKQPYHSSPNQNEHVHLFHGQEHLKSQSDSVKSEFYNVTLDLSNDDIQQTLSANMPVSCANADHLLRLDDDRDNKNLDGTGDDVFVSLDAFDMLTDFQELDILEHATQQASSLVTDIVTNSGDLQPHGQAQLDIDVLQITDYCPEWAFPEGGVKVLITGPWYSSSSYTVMFDTISVPSTLIQGGVLRCYCPAHDIGTVTLQVVVDGRPISTTAIFEYRQHEFPLTISSLSMPHAPSLLKFHLLQKLDTLEDYLQPNSQQADHPLKENIVMFSKPNFEDHLVNYCEKMKQFSWKSESECNVKHLDTETTILHMAAFLGYSKLVCILLQWKLENVSMFLEMEVNVSKQDREGYTPLMWACKKGHKDTAILLCQWYQTIQSSNENFNQEYNQPDILESVHQYFNDFNQNQYYTTDNLNNDSFLKPDGDIKKEISQKFEEPYNSTASPNRSITISCLKEADKPCKNEEIRIQETQGSKRPLPNSFFQMDDYYDQFHKPTVYFPSDQKFQKSLFLPLQSPTSDSGNSSEKSPVLTKSDFIICMVTAQADGPADGAVGSENNGNGNTRSGERQNDAQIEDAVQTPKNLAEHGEQDVRVLTLAEQFIAAMPDHIKNENGSHGKIIDSSISMDVTDDPPSSVSSCCFDANSEINTEFNEHVYRYRQKEREIETPTSSTSLSLSPVSSASQCSPASPPPNAADLCEFLHASSNNQYFEKNFSNLTLSDYEQRELYEAAKTIQKAYRTYKKKEEDKEISAASVIQNYYRRYKQYAYYKQMTKAAVLIQNQYRLYRRHKRFKKEVPHYANNTFTVIKKNQTQKRQNQAARKIQQFMRQSKNRLMAVLLDLVSGKLTTVII